MEEPIKIKRYDIPEFGLYNFDDVYLGTIKNATELADVRLQICNLDLSGYYIMFYGEKIEINNYGVIKEWPNGFYDEEMNIISKLFKSQILKRKNS